ncbi:MAG: RsmE family RNA methyltransferase [Candidatus Omnitrophota bacterium]
MKRFFIDKTKIRNNIVIVSGKEAHHIKDVIRLSVDDRFLGIDGTGKIYTLRIIHVSDVVEAEIEKIGEENANTPRILLACALPKKGRMDYIVEKATELGVTEIVPMITKRTIVKVDKKGGPNKLRRWKSIAVEASKQSGRDMVTHIHNIRGFEDAISLVDKLNYSKKVIPCLGEGTKNLAKLYIDYKGDIVVFIGPEGDFTQEELEFASESGFIPVSLGPLVLRVETACLYCASLIQGIAAL